MRKIKIEEEVDLDTESFLVAVAKDDEHVVGQISLRRPFDAVTIMQTACNTVLETIKRQTDEGDPFKNIPEDSPGLKEAIESFEEFKLRTKALQQFCNKIVGSTSMDITEKEIGKDNY